MDAFFERVILRAATIDELLSDAFEALPGQKSDADLAARRIAAWCRSCTSGDWSLFERRLNRDRFSIAQVLAKFSTVRRRTDAPTPAWINDAMWICAALQRNPDRVKPLAASERAEPLAFEHLFMPIVEQAEALLWKDIDATALNNLAESARLCLRRMLLGELSSLCVPVIYERFTKARRADVTPDAKQPQRPGTARYDRFAADMKAGGFLRLFEEKPVLLRLIATVTRQWIDASRELVVRLDADLPAIRRDLFGSGADSRVTKTEGDLSDPHNGGRSVQILTFEDGARIVYKPKDFRIDVAWHRLIARLNRADPPIELKSVRVIARDGYGWAEFIEHTGCADRDGCARFFRRAGAWLALFHCFAATDMHQENIIAAGDHPVPIDLETILQAPLVEDKTHDPEAQAFEASAETIANSVMMVGLLPTYGRVPHNNAFAVGGMSSNWNSRMRIDWHNINSDDMRPAKSIEPAATTPNLPHVAGSYAKLSDHADDFVAGFEAYAKFLQRLTRSADQGIPLDDFAGLPVRKIVRPTRFYSMLLQRLKDHRNMDDGVIWSAQADFVARMADWDKNSDVFWPLQRAERSALLALNVPHFVSPNDGNRVADEAGVSVDTDATPGIDRARARLQAFSDQAIAWEIEVIGQNINSALRSAARPLAVVEAKERPRPDAPVRPAKDVFAAEADKIAAELSQRAIRRGPGAAWIGLDWLGESEIYQLVPLRPDLYNGVAGIAVFLAAHAAVMGCESSAELALAAISQLRKDLKSRNAGRMTRSWGIGGASGLGSIVYALTVMSKCLGEDSLLEDAKLAAGLFTDDLIAADQQLDVVGGSAGAILGLLRLYRDTRSGDVLTRAIRCGEHLLAQPRVGTKGRRNWVGKGLGPQGLNGMSHGAAGFAYALASLAAATERDDFADAAAECVAFEDSTYDAERKNWPDMRGDSEATWSCKWCHGSPGIGLARIGMTKHGASGVKGNARILQTDIRNALEGAERGWPGDVDTLCCGTLGSVEFFCEAAGALGRDDIRERASRRLMAVVDAATATGDYRWKTGKRQFNLGLFRGLAGAGYTYLRRVDGALPNVLIWE